MTNLHGIADTLDAVTIAIAGLSAYALLATAAIAVAWRRSKRSTPRTAHDTARRAAVGILVTVALSSAALSYEGVVAAVPQSFGPLRYVIPAVADALIAGASLRYITLTRNGRPASGWRTLAHTFVAVTLWLNILSTPTPSEVWWHIIGPLVWSALVELAARDILGELRATRTRLTPDVIPLRLWLTLPAESARAQWRILRANTTVEAARLRTEQAASSRDLLRAALPGKPNRRARRQILRRLWSGALDPDRLTLLIHQHARPDVTVLTAVLTEVAYPGMSLPPPEDKDTGRDKDESPEGQHDPGGPRDNTTRDKDTEEDKDRDNMPRPVMTLPALTPGEMSRVAAALSRPVERVTMTLPAARAGASTVARVNGRATVEDLEAALRDGSLRGIGRDAVKDRFGGATETAGALVRAFREKHGIQRGERFNVAQWVAGGRS